VEAALGERVDAAAMADAAPSPVIAAYYAAQAITGSAPPAHSHVADNVAAANGSHYRRDASFRANWAAAQARPEPIHQ